MILTTKTFQDISQYPTPPDIDGIITYGFYSFGDGGGSILKRVGAPPATNLHAVSATGGIFELCANRDVHVGHFGASTSLANNSPFIQKMLDSVGYFSLPAGDFKCQDEILLRPGAKYLDVVFFGKGRGASRLTAVGMSGAKLIKASSPGYYRFAMRDLALGGDADTALDLTGISPYQFYLSDVSNCVFDSVAGPSVKTDRIFSTTFRKCSFSSQQDHAFYSNGGNSLLLEGCYAHGCGDGKAGYRILGGATLVACTGVDQVGPTHFWGEFGQDTTHIYKITMIGCHMEDWGAAALKLNYAGKLTLSGVGFVAPAVGSYETLIKIASGTSHNILVDNNVYLATKGSSRSGNSNIQGTGIASAIAISDTSNGSLDQTFSDFYNTTFGLLYPISTVANIPGVYGQRDTAINRLKTQLV